MWHVPLLDLHGGRVMGYMGNGAHEHKGQGDGNRGDGNRGDGHIAVIMHRSRWQTGVMGHMGNGAHSGCIQWYG